MGSERSLQGQRCCLAMRAAAAPAVRAAREGGKVAFHAPSSISKAAQRLSTRACRKAASACFDPTLAQHAPRGMPRPGPAGAALLPLLLLLAALLAPASAQQGVNGPSFDKGLQSAGSLSSLSICIPLARLQLPAWRRPSSRGLPPCLPPSPRPALARCVAGKGCRAGRPLSCS